MESFSYYRYMTFEKKSHSSLSLRKQQFCIVFSSRSFLQSGIKDKISVLSWLSSVPLEIRDRDRIFLPIPHPHYKYSHFFRLSKIQDEKNPDLRKMILKPGIEFYHSVLGFLKNRM